MSAEKLALPVRAAPMTSSGRNAELYDADGEYLGSICAYSPPIPADIALRAAEAAAAVINEALTPAWTWEVATTPLRRFYFRGKYHDTLLATDAMAQAMCDGLNAAGVEP